MRIFWPLDKFLRRAGINFAEDRENPLTEMNWPGDVHWGKDGLYIGFWPSSLPI